MEEKTKDVLRETVAELLKKIGFPVAAITVENRSEKDNPSYSVDIEATDETNLLIGRNGENLRALQYVTRLIARKKLAEERVGFTVDINDYVREKNQTISDMTKAAAEEAMREKKTVTLRPMSAYERRLVHMELAANSSVVTESVGDGDNRCVSIRPTIEAGSEK